MGRLAAEAIEAGALGLHDVAHGCAPLDPTGATPRVSRRPADELLGIARAIGATGQGVFEAVADLVDLDARVRAHPGDGRGEWSPAVVDDVAATRVRARRVPADPRADRGRGRRRCRDARSGRGPPRRADPAARRTRAPAPLRHRPTSRSPPCRCPSWRPSCAGPRCARRCSRRSPRRARTSSAASGPRSRWVTRPITTNTRTACARPRGRVRHARCRRRSRRHLRSGHELRRRRLRRDARDARPSAHRPRPGGRGRALHDDLRRQLPDVPACSSGPATSPPPTGCRSSGSSSSSARTPRRWSACTTAACSRRAAGPTSTSSISTHWPCARRSDAPRPARRRQATGAAGRRIPRDARRGRRRDARRRAHRRASGAARARRTRQLSRAPRDNSSGLRPADRVRGR